MSKLNDVLTLLPALSAAYLMKVTSATDMILVKKTATQAPETTPWLYDAMVTVIAINRPFSMFVKTDLFPHWKKKAPTVMQFIAKNFPDMNKVMYNGVSQFLLGMLKDDLLERQTPVTLRSMTVNLDRVPQVFSLHFPGYIEYKADGSVQPVGPSIVWSTIIGAESACPPHLSRTLKSLRTSKQANAKRSPRITPDPCLLR